MVGPGLRPPQEEASKSRAQRSGRKGQLYLSSSSPHAQPCLPCQCQCQDSAPAQGHTPTPCPVPQGQWDPAMRVPAFSPGTPPGQQRGSHGCQGSGPATQPLGRGRPSGPAWAAPGGSPWCPSCCPAPSTTHLVVTWPSQEADSEPEAGGAGPQEVPGRAGPHSLPQGRQVHAVAQNTRAWSAAQCPGALSLGMATKSGQASWAVLGKPGCMSGTWMNAASHSGAGQPCGWNRVDGAGWGHSHSQGHRALAYIRA